MIQSMTGYGAAERAEAGVVYALELKSVNHRYLKISLKLPEDWQFAEAALEKRIRERLSRGSVVCALRIKQDAAGSAETINLAAMQSYLDQLAQVGLPAGVTATIDLATLASLPGCTHTPQIEDETRETEFAIVESVLDRALDDLIAMRREEGGALQEELLRIADEVRARIMAIDEWAPCVVDEYHERLRARVTTLLNKGEFELQAEGLMREVAIYAERCDVSEELTRLKSHLDQFRQLCERDESVGRTLEFLTQELLREANTIASKSNHAGIARNVVDIKGLIDRLKEQVQNVE